MKIIRYILIVVFAVATFYACKEEQRFGLSSDDNVPPGAPTVLEVIPLYGGARIFYDPPTDEDVLQMVAEFDAANGEIFKFSASYFKDSIDVLGLGEDREYTIRLYALDRAGNKSTVVPVQVTPLESSILRVAKTIEVKGSFGSFFLDWYNELQQTVNIVVNFEFDMDGRHRNIVQVLSSNREFDRQFIRDLNLGPDQPINMKITVEDIYGNKTEPKEVNGLVLLQDSKISKGHWELPLPGDSIAGEPMVFGNYTDGRNSRVIDDIIDWRINNNYLNCNGRGRIGGPLQAGDPHHQNDWNLFIDLGDYYYLSRIVTHQRHSGGDQGQNKGQYYSPSSDPNHENVAIYRMWYLDEDVDESVKGYWVNLGTKFVRGVWVPISIHNIEIPIGVNDVEIIQMGQKGDEALMYPDDPGFTPKSVRWFRYEPLFSFQSNKTNLTNKNCLSEVTLFGRYDRPANKN